MRRRRAESACANLFDVLDAVRDPEIPVLSIWDLGILQDVSRQNDGVVVTITPTYSGCPAMQQIEADIIDVLRQAGEAQVQVETRLAPAWSSDWMDADARRRLREYGIAPLDDLRCPQCGSEDVERVSEFGSTACKALYRCVACREPFDQFKRI
jgi:ring-1,2-phenylacetyl-CoA epoxidase subunit PaaD